MNVEFKIIIALWAAFFLYQAFLFVNNKNRKKSKISRKVSDFFSIIYGYLTKIPILKNDIKRVRQRLYNNNLWDDDILNFKVALYYVTAWFIALVSFTFVCIYFKDDSFEIVILSPFCYYLKIILLEHFIGNDIELLTGLHEFNEDLIPDYQHHQDIDKAVEQAQDENSSLITINHIINMKSAIDDGDVLEEYINSPNNIYLKLDALNCHLTNEFGDTFSNENESVFMANIKHFNKLINMDIFKIRAIMHRIGNGAFTCIAPLLAFKPLEMWFDKCLPEANIFYKSSMNFILKILLTILCTAMFFIVRNLSNVDQASDLEKKYLWEEKLLNIKIFSKFISFIIPKRDSKKYYYYRKLIARSQIKTKIEWVFVQKTVIFLAAFIFSLTAAFSAHKINYGNMLDNTTFSMGQTIITVSGEQKNTDELERKIINSIGLQKDKVINKTTEIRNMLLSQGLDDNDETTKLAEKINNKLININNEHVRLYEILICLFFSFISTIAPNLYLKFKIKTNKLSMNSEVMLLETVVLILMNFENTNIELVLNYWSKFAKQFKIPIDNAIYRLQKGTDEALNNVIVDSTDNSLLKNTINEEEILDDLIEKVDFKPFKNLIKNLQKTEDISFVQAFSNLSTHRNDYAKNREEDDEREISRRVSVAERLCRIAYWSVVILYMLVPLMVVTLYKASDIISQVSAGIPK
ncbi:hypothetical protein IAI10_16300 [Clostridium sp. 19966]|uniref:hypothetical protein n=1 Tax=Clostridium sp. 19966 TaxID=2768166 RepID=UPI0028DF45AA|nr:hypothetical protein [Clostridium sp. 19966]MDT8718229.1 hypothetical protein [Clostridium sp. 19966]